MENFPIQLSENILLQAQLGQDTALLRRELYYLKDNKLEQFLNTDELRGVFWSNIYNAFILIISREVAENNLVFKYKRIKIARNILSLDDIEYKILGLNTNRFNKVMNLLFSRSFIKKVAIKNPGANFHTMLDRTPIGRSF